MLLAGRFRDVVAQLYCMERLDPSNSSNDFTETFVKVGNYPLAKSDHGVKLCENRTRENLGNRIISLEY
jgi:hypothetical protein